MSCFNLILILNLNLNLNLIYYFMLKMQVMYFIICLLVVVIVSIYCSCTFSQVVVRLSLLADCVGLVRIVDGFVVIGSITGGFGVLIVFVTDAAFFIIICLLSNLILQSYNILLQ